MTNLLICVTGDAGGTDGPYGVFHLMKTRYDNHIFDVICFDTIPHNIKINSIRIVDMVNEIGNKYKNIYFVGWSLGGPTVTSAVRELQHLGIKNIGGIVLLAPSYCYDNIQHLTCPISYIHGTLDRVTLCEKTSMMYDKYKYSVRFKKLEGYDHWFNKDTFLIADSIYIMLIEMMGVELPVY